MTWWIPVATVVAVAVGALCWWLRRRHLVVTVEGRSMEPTYVAGDQLLVRRTRPSRIRRGQVVVFTKAVPASGDEPARGAGHAGRRGAAPGPAAASGIGCGVREAPWIIKRVVAVPGDPVPAQAVPALCGSEGSRVPPGHLVVLGDNAERSFDSRSFGYLTADRVFGTVLRPIAVS